MIRTFLTEDKQIINIDHPKLRCIQSSVVGDRTDFYDSYIKENKYIECFDSRKLTNISGKSHTIVLENDTMIPEEIEQFAESLSKIGGGLTSNIYQPFLGINHSSHKEGQIKHILDYIRDNGIQNICIDSLFIDLEQFELFCKLCLNRLYRINLFVNSHGTLLNTLNTNFLKNEDVIDSVNNLRVYDIDFSTMMFNKISYSWIQRKYINVNTFYYQK